nr:hypothetical protein [Aquibacillus albus]
MNTKIDSMSETQKKHGEILDEHTELLNEHSRILNEHTELLNEHSRILNVHTEQLNEHGRILNEHTEQLNEHGRILNEHTSQLNEHSQTLEEHGLILRSLRTGQESLQAEVSEIKLQNAEEAGSMKKEIAKNEAGIEILKEESWSNRIDTQRIKKTMGMA